MSSPRSIDNEVGGGPSSVKNNGAKPHSHSHSHSPRVIPNIPPRASFSSSQRPQMSLTSHSQSNTPLRDRSSAKPTPKASNDSLQKQAISPPNGAQQSALTASMASPNQGMPIPDADIPSVPSPAAYDATGSHARSHDSGAVTPRGGADESGWSNLAEIPDEKKAAVLRRHLVSAEERGHSKTGTPAALSPGELSPVKVGEGGPSKAAGDSAVTWSDNHSQPDDSSFPIPYDALGGDVT